MDQVGLPISRSQCPILPACGEGSEFGDRGRQDGSQHSAMLRDPDGQLLELLSDGWVSALPLRPRADSFSAVTAMDDLAQSASLYPSLKRMRRERPTAGRPTAAGDRVSDAG